ncbi:Short-chain dehydrogenase, partial [Globisporangium splendens]
MAKGSATSAANEQAIHTAVTNAFCRHEASRPKRTQKQYVNKQEDFRQWCASKQFDDGHLVYEGKLILFLTEYVIPRGNRRQKTADGTPKALGLEAIDAYIKAVTALYKLQQSLSNNNHPHPRGLALHQLIKTLKYNETRRKLEEFVDRGLGTVLDGYNLEDMKALGNYWLKENSGTALRDRVDFLLGHALIARGESRRLVQFPDMLTLDLTDEGPQLCTPLVIIMRQGKTNQFGRVEYGAAMRCKELLLCPLNSVATYLFWRWHIELEPFPDLSERPRWYGIHLLKGANAMKELSYNAQLQGVKKAFAACGIDSSVWTHATRSSAAKMAELQGADEAQIRRAGRWNSEKMEGCYLTTLARKAMRALAGFPTKGGSYWLPRASITPSDKLQKMVYRDLEHGQEQLDSSSNREIAGGAFVNMLHNMRVVFLQDSVILRREFSDHPLWSDPLFSTPDYREFETEVLRALPNIEQPEYRKVESAIPHVASVLRDGFASIHSKLDGVVVELTELKRKTSSICKKRFVVSLAPDSSDEEIENDPSSSAPHLADKAPKTSVRDDAAAANILKLSRSVTTVTHLWVEYTKGFAGQISVMEAEKLYGPKWRTAPTENRFYSRRKRYYDAINLLATKLKIPSESAAQIIESKRVAAKKSLNGFVNDLKLL